MAFYSLTVLPLTGTFLGDAVESKCICIHTYTHSYLYIIDLREPGNGNASAKTYAGFGKLVLLVAQFPDFLHLKGALMFCV